MLQSKHIHPITEALERNAYHDLSLLENQKKEMKEAKRWHKRCSDFLGFAKFCLKSIDETLDACAALEDEAVAEDYTRYVYDSCDEIRNAQAKAEALVEEHKTISGWQDAMKPFAEKERLILERGMEDLGGGECNGSVGCTATLFAEQIYRHFSREAWLLLDRDGVKRIFDNGNAVTVWRDKEHQMVGIMLTCKGVIDKEQPKPLIWLMTPPEHGGGALGNNKPPFQFDKEPTKKLMVLAKIGNLVWD